MKNIILLLSVLFMFSFVACDDKNDDGDFYIKFDKKEVKLNAIEGTSEIIEISSSSTWSLDTELPDWIGISDFVGDESPMSITITANRNDNMEKREATLIFHNSDDIKQSIKIIQLGLADSDPFIELSEKSMDLAIDGAAKSIDLTTNVSWEITSVPTWLVISSKSGDKSTRITIGAEENDQIKAREATLTFSSKDGKVKGQLSIYQTGREDIIQSPFLPIFHYSVFSNTNNGHYNVTTENLFVNATLRDKIYLGNLMENKTEIYPSFPIPTGYTFNPISAITTQVVNPTSRTFVPSFQEQEAFGQEATANPPRENASLTHDYFNPTSYPTHRVLYSIGWANMGIALDKIVSGVSYKEQEMTKKNGMIFSFKHTLFTFVMDYPQKLIKEELRDADKGKNLSYINYMEYGKVGLLIVESDAKYDRMRDAVRSVLIGEENSIHQAEFDALIEAADISYVYFNNKNEVQLNKNKKDAIKAYKTALSNKKDKENIYPIGFTLQNFGNHTADKIIYSFDALK
ncbi:hypothetical protein IR148_03930 [Dysgonomonas mossii]|uniref:BACON domain-containing protein n=1 Tax=Dysgonomonas mossii TaxID=163665 RepID=A0A4Y9IRC4_9BACT|nr:BACON domain-containing carbohydrate-binding protein [Dysgonomonas mossii]MBF0760191.1 hypothetical protein [Dysgonomonas mossii]TFU91140.1 hypothetical protein E4T88_03925 [Dysgonomonas mossii]